MTLAPDDYEEQRELMLKVQMVVTAFLNAFEVPSLTGMSALLNIYLVQAIDSGVTLENTRIALVNCANKLYELHASGEDIYGG